MYCCNCIVGWEVFILFDRIDYVSRVWPLV